MLPVELGASIKTDTCYHNYLDKNTDYSMLTQRYDAKIDYNYFGKDCFAPVGNHDGIHSYSLSDAPNQNDYDYNGNFDRVCIKFT